MARAQDSTSQPRLLACFGHSLLTCHLLLSPTTHPRQTTGSAVAAARHVIGSLHVYCAQKPRPKGVCCSALTQLAFGCFYNQNKQLDAFLKTPPTGYTNMTVYFPLEFPAMQDASPISRIPCAPRTAAEHTVVRTTQWQSPVQCRLSCVQWALQTKSGSCRE
jgi:hypothetical protein